MHITQKSAAVVTSTVPTVSLADPGSGQTSGGRSTAKSTIDTTDLADELADRFDITRAAAREGVDTYLGQINDIDHTAWDREMPGDISDFIRESFAAFYADAE